MSDAVIISIVGAGATLAGVTLTAYVNFRLGKIHKQLNSRMDELLMAAQAKGNLQGRKELKEEQSKKK